MTITTIEAISYNWFEWPNIISFFVAILGVVITGLSLVLLVLEKASVRATTIIFFTGVVLGLTGVVWGIADEATTEVVYERVVHQVVDSTR